MIRRLYFVLPDVDTSRKVEDDLLLARIDDRHMHFLGKSGTDLKDLPKVGVMQKSDAIHAIVIGAFIGCIGGAATVTATTMFPETSGLRIGWAWVLPLAVLGGLVGMWVSGKPFGSSTPHYHGETFTHALEEGHILLMIDLPVDRVEEIRELIKSHYPQAEDHGIDPTIPAFP